jgi:hypothetical protein
MIINDISLLSARLLGATRWVRGQNALSDQRIGYFGASTGAAAALVAASEDDRVGAVVSRGGRPDLAQGTLKRVSAPTLLIVGGGRCSRYRDERRGDGSASMRETDGGRVGSIASLRGARCSGACVGAGARLVRREALVVTRSGELPRKLVSSAQSVSSLPVSGR